MKYRFMLFIIVSLFSVQALGQIAMEEGNTCFDKGDYACAIKHYNAVLALEGVKREYKESIKNKIQNAKECLGLLDRADEAFKAKKFTEAKQLYLDLKSKNPKDANAQSQINECEAELNKDGKPLSPPKGQTPPTATLSVSSNSVLFSTDGGKQRINVNTGANSYSITLIPSWCSILKFEKYFDLSCTPNNTYETRWGQLKVSAGDNETKITIEQKATEKKETLSVSKENLTFPASGGVSERIKVYASKNTYSVSDVPFWCSVEKQDDYFIVSCTVQKIASLRSGWFRVTMGDKEVKISVNQEGADKPPTPVPPKPAPRLGYAHFGYEGGLIAPFGVRFDYMSKTGLGFFANVRTSFASSEAILSGKTVKNKTEVIVGPTVRISHWLIFNIGAGLGNYQSILRNDYASVFIVQKTQYLAAYGGIMLKIKKVGIVGGVSYIDIGNDFYKPEFTAGLTYQIK